MGCYVDDHDVGICQDDARNTRRSTPASETEVSSQPRSAARRPLDPGEPDAQSMMSEIWGPQAQGGNAHRHTPMDPTSPSQWLGVDPQQSIAPLDPEVLETRGSGDHEFSMAQAPPKMTRVFSVGGLSLPLEIGPQGPKLGLRGRALRYPAARGDKTPWSRKVRQKVPLLPGVYFTVSADVSGALEMGTGLSIAPRAAGARGRTWDFSTTASATFSLTGSMGAGAFVGCDLLGVGAELFGQAALSMGPTLSIVGTGVGFDPDTGKPCGTVDMGMDISALLKAAVGMNINATFLLWSGELARFTFGEWTIGHFLGKLGQKTDLGTDETHHYAGLEFGLGDAPKVSEADGPIVHVYKQLRMADVFDVSALRTKPRQLLDRGIVPVPEKIREVRGLGFWTTRTEVEDGDLDELPSDVTGYSLKKVPIVYHVDYEPPPFVGPFLDHELPKSARTFEFTVLNQGSSSAKKVTPDGKALDQIAVWREFEEQHFYREGIEQALSSRRVGAAAYRENGRRQLWVDIRRASIRHLGRDPQQ